jgi:hypothetical protein
VLQGPRRPHRRCSSPDRLRCESAQGRCSAREAEGELPSSPSACLRLQHATTGSTSAPATTAHTVAGVIQPRRRDRTDNSDPKPPRRRRHGPKIECDQVQEDMIAGAYYRVQQSQSARKPLTDQFAAHSTARSPSRVHGLENPEEIERNQHRERQYGEFQEHIIPPVCLKRRLFWMLSHRDLASCTDHRSALIPSRKDTAENRNKSFPRPSVRVARTSSGPPDGVTASPRSRTIASPPRPREYGSLPCDKQNGSRHCTGHCIGCETSHMFFRI